MKSIKKFENKKVLSPKTSKINGGNLITTQTWGRQDIRVVKTVYTNRLDGSVSNDDRIDF